jgi:hypothetical protein
MCSKKLKNKSGQGQTKGCRAIIIIIIIIIITELVGCGFQWGRHHEATLMDG